MYSHLEVTLPKIAKRHSATNRTRSVSYNLPDSSGKRHGVCKKFFLSTFGYMPTASVINDLLCKTDLGSPTPTEDRRGGRRESLTVNKDRVMAHILTYNPCLPHYRRAHATKRLYLPPELTIQAMVEDYNIKNAEEKACYSSYEREVKKLNISFTRLSTEECELCKTLALSHIKFVGTRDCVSDCDACVCQNQHDQLKSRGSGHIQV